MSPFCRSRFQQIAEEKAAVLHAKHRSKVHLAFVFRDRNELLAMACNRIGSRSRGAGFSDFTIHAERAVLRQVDARKLRGATLVVIRISTHGELMNSSPCEGCQCHIQKCIRKYGLRRVYYS